MPTPSKTNCGDMMVSNKDIMRMSRTTNSRNLPLENTKPLPPVPVLRRPHQAKNGMLCTTCILVGSIWELNVPNHNNWCASKYN